MTSLNKIASSRVACLAVAIGLLAALHSASEAQTAKQLRIGVQFGLGYLPFHVASQAGLLEKHMRAQGLEPVPVQFVQVTGAPQINDALLSGNLEVGSGGYTAMMVFVDRTRAAGDSQFLGVTALSNVPYDLYTVDPNVRTLADLNRDKHKIGVPSVKVSVPAVFLQMAAEKLYGAGKHAALDDLTVSLSQPDGVVSLLSGGGAVSGYIFAPPFSHQMAERPNIKKVWSSNELFGTPATALVGWTTVKFRRDNPKLYAAVVAAMKEAMALIAMEPKRGAEIFIKAENSKLSPEFIAQVLADTKNLRYTLAPEQSIKIAEFLLRTGSIKKQPESWKDLFFPEIHGEPGS